MVHSGDALSVSRMHRRRDALRFLYSRQHLQVSHGWTVSDDRPDMRTMDVALHVSCALGESDESSSCSQRQRIRFVLKRRLHQKSIDSAFGRADCLARNW